jgi:CheY-like chemotaxis protein
VDSRRVAHTVRRPPILVKSGRGRPPTGDLAPTVLAPIGPPVPEPLTILVVDDHIDTADSLARFLRVAVGHDVRVAYDGALAVRLAAAVVPRAVVCDLNMPKLDGLRTAEVLAKLDPRPLLIAVTAFAGEYPEAKAREAGFDHYLSKPADPFTIEALIRDRTTNVN